MITNYLTTKFVGRKLDKILGREKAAAVVRTLESKGDEKFREMDRAASEVRGGLWGNILRRVFLTATLIYWALRENLERDEADNAFRQLLHPIMRPMFSMSMRPLPKGKGAFEVFKKRYDKANRPLTLLKWSEAENTPTTYQTDFSVCGLADITRLAGFPEACRFFCEFDEIFFSDYDERLRFIRNETIASGGERCTFRFEWDGE